MGVEKQIRFVCERCGVRSTWLPDDENISPEGWGQFVLANPIRTEIEMLNRSRFRIPVRHGVHQDHSPPVCYSALCPPCVSDVEAHWKHFLKEVK